MSRPCISMCQSEWCDYRVGICGINWIGITLREPRYRYRYVVFGLILHQKASVFLNYQCISM
jgi:hypothetical protein